MLIRTGRINDLVCPALVGGNINAAPRGTFIRDFMMPREKKSNRKDDASKEKITTSQRVAEMLPYRENGYGGR